MTAASTTLLVVAAAAALVHWWSVAGGRRAVLLATKPLVMLLLIAVAAGLDTTADATTSWFILALGLSLAGDVFLMVEPDRFVAGLASFLGAHLAYIAGLLLAGFEPVPALIAAALAAGLFLPIGRPILQGAAAADRRLAAPVAAYIGVISAMVITAAATGNAVALAGAASFYASDAVLGWNRFVAPLPNGRLITMITYHLGQGLLVLALVTL